METDVLREPRARPTPGPHRPTTAVPGNPGPHAGHQEGHRYIYIHRPEKEGAFAGVRIRLHYLRLRPLRLPPTPSWAADDTIPQHITPTGGKQLI